MARSTRWMDDLTDRSMERQPPPDDASDVDWLLFEQSGVLTYRQAADALSPGKVRHLLADGLWQSPRAGLVVAHNGTLTEDQRLWAAVLGCGSGAVLAGLAAARAAGLRRDLNRAVDVLVPAASRPLQLRRGRLRATGQLPAVAVHRTTILNDIDVVRRARPPRTGVARSLIDAASWASTDDEARSLVVAACRQRLTTPGELLEAAGRLRRAPRRAVVLEAVGYTARGLLAISEINFARLCTRHRFPQPERQATRVDRAGRLRYLDAHWPELRLVAEVDGSIHLEPEVYWDDMFRQNAVWIGGERIVRFPAWSVLREEEVVITQLREAMIQCGWDGKTLDLGYLSSP